VLKSISYNEQKFFACGARSSWKLRVSEPASLFKFPKAGFQGSAPLSLLYSQFCEAWNKTNCALITFIVPFIRSIRPCFPNELPGET
jgi:hypothetical protein